MDSTVIQCGRIAPFIYSTAVQGAFEIVIDCLQSMRDFASVAD
jgi:hypothetical protein